MEKVEHSSECGIEMKMLMVLMAVEMLMGLKLMVVVMRLKVMVVCVVMMW